MSRIDDLIIRKNMSRGVVVGPDGHFMAALQWESGGPSPEIPRKRVKGAAAVLLTDEAALNPPSEKAKWDFAKREWSSPTDVLDVVEESTGRYIGKKIVWMDRLPSLPRGQVYVRVSAPVSRSRRPIWNSAAGEWQYPRRVALLDAEGIVQNIVLENPRDDTENVPVPEGWSRLDESEWGDLKPIIGHGMKGGKSK